MYLTMTSARDMRNVFVRADFRVLHRRAEEVGRCHRRHAAAAPALVVVQQRQQ